MFAGVVRLFRALDAVRLPPGACRFPERTDIFSLTELIPIAVLLVIARLIVADASSPAAGVILTALAVVVFLIAGAVARRSLTDRSADTAAGRAATFLLLYFMLSLFIIDTADLLPVLSGHQPIGYVLFAELPMTLFGVELPAILVAFLRAALVSVLVWLLWVVKTKRRVEGFRARDAFATWEFPVYAWVNSLVLLALVFSWY
jgi:hypothetical protein